MSQEQLHAGEERTVGQPGLRGKTCVVTGASRGIGREIALALGRAGANVAVNYRSSSAEARAVVDHIEAAAGDAVEVQADVTDPGDVATMADAVTEAFGPAEVLVNNAGVTADASFAKMSHEQWARVIDTNLNGTFNCTKAFFEDLREAADGRLLTVSSVVGQQGNYGQANYAASKSALEGFTRTLSIELAPHGSTANCVAPGFTRTDMVAAVREDVQDRIREGIPMNRFADPEEVAAVVAFLASDLASYVTGEVISVNGGLRR